MEIREIQDKNTKASICDAVLRALPSWFGIESSIVAYVHKVRDMPFYAAFEAEKPIGFVALKVHNKYTAEIDVMGIEKEYHRHGIGRNLVAQCEQYCIDHQHEFLTVKTLDEARVDEGYEKTRRFYHSLGFRPLEVFPLLWSKENPCLFLAKYLGNR